MSDDDLRVLMRTADPAPHAPQLAEHDIRRIVAAAERDQINARGPQHSVRQPRRRAVFGRRGLLAGGLTGAAVGTAVLASILTTPAVQAPLPPLGGEPSGPSVTSCAPVSVQNLAANDTAYQATVVSEQGSSVTLHVTDVFVGTLPDQVVVAQMDSLDDAISEPLFRVGESYLVASTNGELSQCGQTDIATDTLHVLYEQAFR